MKGNTNLVHVSGYFLGISRNVEIKKSSYQSPGFESVSSSIRDPYFNNSSTRKTKKNSLTFCLTFLTTVHCSELWIPIWGMSDQVKTSGFVENTLSNDPWQSQLGQWVSGLRPCWSNPKTLLKPHQRAGLVWQIKGHIMNTWTDL